MAFDKLFSQIKNLVSPKAKKEVPTPPKPAPEKVPLSNSNIETPEIPVNHFVLTIPGESQNPTLYKKLQIKLTECVTNKENKEKELKKQAEALAASNKKKGEKKEMNIGIDRVSTYRFEILNSLLKTKKIDTLQLEKHLRGMYPGVDFSPSVFNLLCDEIKKFVEDNQPNKINLKTQTIPPIDKPSFDTMEINARNRIIFAKLLDLAEQLKKLNNLETAYKIAILRKFATQDNVKQSDIVPDLATESNFNAETFNQAFTDVKKFMESGGQTPL